VGAADAAPSWARRSATIVVAAGVAVLLAVAGIVVFLDQAISRVPVDGLRGGSGSNGSATAPAGDGADPDGGVELEQPDAPDVDVPELDARPLTVLLVGSDSREVLTPDERRELGTGMAWGERTEVVALVRLDPAAETIRMLNIPRDTVVTRCDGSRGRVNAAFYVGERDGVGGLTCLVRSLTDWSGLPIDHVVKVDFRGFVDIVDAIGGVDLVLEEPLYDEKANLDLPAGEVTLDGADALAFVRARRIDDDFGRIARQQRFVRELQAQVAELGALDDLPQLLRLAEATARSVELDDSLTLNQLRALVLGHRETLRKDLDTRTVPGVPDTSTGAYLLMPDEDAAGDLFRWLRTGVAEGAAAPDVHLVPGDADPPAGSRSPGALPSDGPSATARVPAT
jgi:LCP family protein required for cell wall assembly